MISDKLYLAWKRMNSMETNQKEILKLTENVLGLDDFFPWDADFKKVIEFNKIGVFRCGGLIHQKQG